MQQVSYVFVEAAMDARQPKAQEQIKRRQVAVPSTFQVRSEGPFLMVAYPWNDFLSYLIAPIMLTFAGPILSIVLFHLLGSISIMVSSVLIVFMVASSYRALAGLVNKVTVVVGGGRLDIRYGPLPWPGKTIGTRHIQQLYVTRDRVHMARRRTVNYNRHVQLNRPSSDMYFSYQLRAIVRDDIDIKLLGALRFLDEGLYLEQAIENHLGIADYLVPGSLTS